MTTKLSPPDPGGRLMMLVPAAADVTADAIDLRELVAVLWRGRAWIAACALVFGASALAYALLAQPWYRAEVVLIPANDRAGGGLAGQLGGLGGLASLAGINLDENTTAEPLAVLASREFTRGFIVDERLMPLLFAEQWDGTTKRWLETDPAKQPDLRDGVKMFDERIRGIREDKKAGLVRVTIDWTDPQIAAQWANTLVERLNQRMRAKALAASESNIKYLRQELGSTDVVVLQQSLGRLLESELQKSMLARGFDEYAFKVIDPAEPPRTRLRPRRVQLLIVGAFAGAVLGVLVVLGRGARERWVAAPR